MINIRIMIIGILILSITGLASGVPSWQVYEEALDPQVKNLTENEKSIIREMARSGDISVEEMVEIKKENSQVWTITFLGIFLILSLLICLWLWWKWSKW